MKGKGNKAIRGEGGTGGQSGHVGGGEGTCRNDEEGKGKRDGTGGSGDKRKELKLVVRTSFLSYLAHVSYLFMSLNYHGYAFSEARKI